MIINIRGTHGSGKSTVVRQIIERYAGQPMMLPNQKKPAGYCMPGAAKVQHYHFNRPLYVVGPYVTACGGCDAIQPYSDIWPRVADFAQRGHVVFEGALISTNYGTIGEASEAYGDDFIFALLDTPLELCLERVRKRREAKGNMKPLNTKQTETKHRNIYNMCMKIRDQFKRRVVIIDHRKPVSQLLGLLNGSFTG